MNAAEAVKRLSRERRDWRAAGEGPEVSWTVKGLDIALKVVHDLAKEERIRALQRRPRLNRWIAGELFRAIRQALAYLHRGDRRRAVAMLEAARDAALALRQLPKEGNHGH